MTENHENNLVFFQLENPDYNLEKISSVALDQLGRTLNPWKT